MSAQPADVLAVLKRHLLLAQEVASEEQVAEAREVLAAVDELAAAAENLEVAANTARYCYTRRPENFASALQAVDEAAASLRAALARVQGGAA